MKQPNGLTKRTSGALKRTRQLGQSREQTERTLHKKSPKSKDTSNKAAEIAKRPYKKSNQADSKSQAKARSAPPRTEAQYSAKPEKFKDTWERVLSAISKMRRDKVSLSQAARDAGTSPRTVTKWGKSALRKQKSGKYAAKASDRLLRIVMIPTPEGMREIAVRESKQVRLLAEYWNALHKYIDTGDSVQLRVFRENISRMQTVWTFHCQRIFRP